MCVCLRKEKSTAIKLQTAEHELTMRGKSGAGAGAGVEAIKPKSG